MGEGPPRVSWPNRQLLTPFIFPVFDLKKIHLSFGEGSPFKRFILGIVGSMRVRA